MGLVYKNTGFFSFSRVQICLAAAIASLPGGVLLLSLNYLCLGERRKGITCLFLALCLSVALVILFLSLPPSSVDQFFPLLSCIIMIIVGRNFPTFRSGWRSWLSSILLALCLLFSEVMLAMSIYPFVQR